MSALANRMRPCVVVLRNGRVYEGRAAIEDRWLHFDGHRRLASSNRPTCDEGAKSWPQTAVAEVQWLEVER